MGRSPVQGADKGGLASARPLIWRLPFEMASAAVARRTLNEELAGAGVTRRQLEDVALVLTEMVHNAVAHGQPLSGEAVEVSWAMADATLHVSVRDGGTVQALRPKRPAETDPGGRGLLMIGGLASRWRLTRQHGTVVTAEFDLQASDFQTSDLQASDHRGSGPQGV